mmetsp:Transcript_29483/g.28201  ORF Transcript_29483/g.28201 Transcript_29483/m.28201 type:complete len:442 (+) Transcript_29483:141-1466(+)
MPSTHVFSYQSNPQPIRPGKKYREDENGLSLSLMSDPRVIRGTTTTVNPAVKKVFTLKDAVTARNSTLSNTKRANNQSSYSFESKKYCSEELDLSKYLTEETEKIPISKPAESQTDEFDNRPPTPDYVPRKTGVDTSTQIIDTTELFNFDEEIDPILEIITKKVIEQALAEVNAEEELSALGESILNHEKSASVEKAWIKEKERDAVDLLLLKENEVKVVSANNKAKHETTVKVAALQAMRQLMDDIVDGATNELLRNGDWSNPLIVNAQASAVALMEESRITMESYNSAEEVMDELLAEAHTRYTEMAAYEPIFRRMELSITFQNDNTGEEEEIGEILVDEVKEEDVDGEPIEGSSSSQPKETAPVVPDDSNKIGPIMVVETDTIASIEEKILIELEKKNLTHKRFKLYSYIVAALRGREFPLDVCILNFDLPATLNIVV